MVNLKKLVINEFASKKTQEIYVQDAEKGLWPSEKVLIKKYFKKNSSVLDIGCGTGRTTLALYKIGYNVIGVDLVSAMIKNAKKIARAKKINVKYQVGDAVNLKFKDESFDNIIFSFNGWTQIPGEDNRVKALKEIFRLLKPGGYFIFTTHIRKMYGLTFFWIKQWLRLYLMKPLGCNIEEIDFGDRFFYDRGRGKQFIHIPSYNKVIKQIKKVGFKLDFSARSNVISPKDNQEFPPMFFVCKK